jgi:hypothetical protein
MQTSAGLRLGKFTIDASTQLFERFEGFNLVP